MVEGFQEAGQAGGAGVLLGQRARDPGEFRAQGAGPGRVQGGPEGVEARADAAGRASEGAGRLRGVLRGRRVPVEPQRTEELGGPGPQMAGQDVHGIRVPLCHAGASGRQ
ncbi:hypothetical protein ASR50_17970 [Streptomyces sp. 4F]|nr:hypothetical protein ASR50_17970 [Streptomyces sp. 4F]